MLDDLPNEGLIDPSLVRFSQDSIHRSFRTGGTIDELADSLRAGRIGPSEVPPIRIFGREGWLFTLDNRRLWSFRESGRLIRYRKAIEQEIRSEAWKLTTKNEGLSVRVKDGA